MNDPIVKFNDEFLKDMEIISTMVSPKSTNVGIVILGEFTRSVKEDKTIRFYKIVKTKDMFEVEKELQAFTFPSTRESKRFIRNLPKMSALDMLMMIS